MANSQKSVDIDELIKILEMKSGQKVTLSARKSLLSKQNKVGRPKKLSNPLLALVAYHVLYKAHYEEIVLKRNSKPLSITQACEQIAKIYLSRRNPKLGVMRFQISDKNSDSKTAKTVVVANCARSIRRLYYEARKKINESPYIASKIQGVLMATEQDKKNLIEPFKK